MVLVLVPYYASGLASDEPTHGDESYWIAAGWRAASLIFVERDLRSPYWKIGTSVSILDMRQPKPAAANRNPKFGTLLIGLPVLIMDAPAARWTPYAYRRSVEWNRQNGRLHSRETMLAARLPVAMLGVCAALWFFGLLRTFAEPGWAFVGALLLGTNPLVHLVCRRAMLDGPAYAFTILAVWWAVSSCRSPERWKAYLVTGFFACLAISCKLNAGILLPILGVAFAYEGVRTRTTRPLIYGAAAGALALVLFVALNPTLYSDPFTGIFAMLRLGTEIGGVGRYFPEVALPTLWSRAGAANDLLLIEYGMLTSRLGIPVDHILLALGLVSLVKRASGSAPVRVLLIWLVVSVAAVVFWPPVRWDRYFLPAFAPIVAVEGVGLSVLFSAFLRIRSMAIRVSTPGPKAGPERNPNRPEG